MIIRYHIIVYSKYQLLHHCFFCIDQTDKMTCPLIRWTLTTNLPLLLFSNLRSNFSVRKYTTLSAEDITSSKATSISNVKCVLLNTIATSTSLTTKEKLHQLPISKLNV